MKIAFASCMCTQVFSNQPVWDEIAAQNPDFIVLLGDSIYLDINTHQHPSEMTDNEFGQHIFKLYTEIINQPQFNKLIRSMPQNRVFSIWDDHDFLWNDANGAAIAPNPQHKGKIRLSTALQRSFRQAISQSLAANSFPMSYADSTFWNFGEPPLATPSIQLSSGLWLHLADVRTYRTGTWLVPADDKTILGENQRKNFESKIKSSPNAIHLFASGTTISDWKPYRQDLGWLLDLASQVRMMVLSGDIHRNETDIFKSSKPGFSLHELTSSGAAVKDAVVLGKPQENFGLIEISQNTVTASLYHFNQVQISKSLNIATWD